MPFLQLYVPSIGEQFKLATDWEVPIYFEGRNELMIRRISPNTQFTWRDSGSIMATFKKGTILQVDRIYIRKGKGEWDSITFFVKEAPGDEKRVKFEGARWYCDKERKALPDGVQMKFKGGRFWAKLEDVNQIKFVKVS